MKILILDTMYPRFLRSIGFADTPGVDDTYDALLASLMGTRFGVSDSYSNSLIPLGHEVREVVPNSIRLQGAWAREHGVSLSRGLENLSPSIAARVPVFSSFSHWLPTLQRILLAQVRSFRPDVLYVQDLNVASPSLYKELKKSSGVLVGQIASPLPDIRVLRSFDLLLSSLPNLVDYFRAQGLSSDYLPLAFDARVLGEIEELPRDIDISFVGGISRNHGSTIPLLDEVSRGFPGLALYGYGADSLAQGSALQKLHRGEAWGKDMYRVLGRSKVTLNRHISMSESYANNMRLYEATGMGALLITDKKQNLGKIFEVGTEILAYGNPVEAREMVEWSVSNPVQAAKIAEAGQRRTLSEHTYENVMTRLSAILEKVLGTSGVC